MQVVVQAGPTQLQGTQHLREEEKKIFASKDVEKNGSFKECHYYRDLPSFFNNSLA